MPVLKTLLFYAVLSIFPAIGCCQIPPPTIKKVSFDLESNNPVIYWNPIIGNIDAFYVKSRFYNIQITDTNNVTRTANHGTWKNDTDDNILNGEVYMYTLTNNNNIEPDTLHSPLFIDAYFDTCSLRYYLNWEPYTLYNENDFNDKTPLPIQSYSLYHYEKNTKQLTLLKEISSVGDTFSFSFNDITFTTPKFVMAAHFMNNGVADTAFSNQVEVLSSVPQAPSQQQLTGIISSNEGISLNYNIDDNSGIIGYSIIRSKQINQGYQEIAYFNKADLPANFADETPSSDSIYYYKINTVNECGTTISESENTMANILTRANVQNSTVNMNWNKYEGYFINGLDSYIVSRKIGNENNEVLEDNWNQNSFSDNEIAELAGKDLSSNFCYTITALELGNNGKSVSNTACVSIPTGIRFEFNAFTPGNTQGNNTFGPQYDFLPQSFSFQIFSQNGQAIFQSNDIRKSRWDGKIKGKMADEGVYSYSLKYTTGSGHKESMNGSFMLVH